MTLRKIFCTRWPGKQDQGIPLHTALHLAHQVQRLSRASLPSDTAELARYLIGKTIVRKPGKNRISGRIVETEAYRPGVSSAFIKELMRRCAQFQIETSGGKLLMQAAVDTALEEMLFAGGALNRRLLGGEVTEPSRANGGVAGL
jgi:Methylpurine-DNA glycosylase (MPG)